jgi:hypothetical protein
MRASAQMDIAETEADQFRRPQARLRRKRQQSVVAPPGPSRAVRCVQQRIQFRLSEEGNKLSVKALAGNSEQALDDGGMLWMPKRRVPEQRTDGGEPGITGAGTIFPLLFKVVEAGADERRIQIADVQLRWLDTRGFVTAGTSCRLEWRCHHNKTSRKSSDKLPMKWMRHWWLTITTPLLHHTVGYDQSRRSAEVP